MTAFVRRQYKDLLWRSMDVLGVSESIGRKISVAVGIQFVISLAQATVPFFASGFTRYLLVVVLFAGAIVAFVNTLLIARDDIVTPVERLEAAADDIVNGNLDTDVPDSNQRDELGDLIESFGRMQSSLHTVEQQAEALANHDFDADAFEKDVPGRFGELLAQMTHNVRSFIERLDNDRNRFQLLNHLVSHDIPNLLNVLMGRGEFLREEIDDSDGQQHLDIVLEQADQILEITRTVHQLSTTGTTEEVDLTDILTEEIAYANDSFPEATVETETLPDEAYVDGNDLLRSVFGNLITNAIEHNDGDSTHVEVIASNAHGEIIVSVADNGPGIPDEEKDGFFDDLEPSSGLGLVSTVTNRFDGEVWVTDNEPNGTVFNVRLPTADSAAENGDRTDAFVPTGGPRPAVEQPDRRWRAG